MNENKIEDVVTKLSNVSSLLNTLVQESLALQEKDRQIERNKEIVLRKEGDVNAKTALLNKEKSELEIKRVGLTTEKNILLEEKKKLDERERKFSEQLAILIKEKQQVNEKIDILRDLEDKKKELDEREQELIKKLQNLAERESLVEKEKIIDRERKERLDAKESDLKTKAERIQKMIAV